MNADLFQRPPVYVDPLMIALISRNWRHPTACHMFVDVTTDIDVLHAFAAKIGLKRCWFQHKRGKMSHYDLNESRRKIAVAAGAVELDRRSAVEIIRKYRAPLFSATTPRS
jgi:hypothetical protein